MGGRVARPWSVLPAVVVAAMVVASPVAGQGGDEGPSEEPASAPDAPDGLRAIPAPAVGDANVAEAPDSPTDVAIRIDLVQILGIDERRSLFEVDAILTAQWVDKRGVESCTSRQVHRGENAAEVLKTTIWAPTFVIEFGREPRSKKALEVSVSCDGNVTYEERFTAAVTQRFTNLNDFPFDDHVIRFKVVPFGREGRESVRFGPLVRSETDEDLAAQKLADKFEAEEWKFEVEPGEPVPSPPSITTRIRIDRETRYYWMNIIAPLVFIVSISWIVLWMKPVLHERLGVSITILLTVVAFDFLTGDSLPKLSFTTRIDQFYNLSYLFVGLTIAVSFFATRRGAHAGGADDAGGDVGDDDPHRPGSVAVSQVDHWSRLRDPTRVPRRGGARRLVRRRESRSRGGATGARSSRRRAA